MSLLEGFMSAVTRKVLIVDDDPWVGKLVEFVARDLGYEPLLARDGAEALELFAEELPDVVVADVVLPRIDGLEVCRRVKSTGPGAFTPVLVVSGVYRSEREALKRFRADGFFAKPLSPETLQKRLGLLFPPAFAPADPPPLTPAADGEVSLEFEPLARALARLYQKRRTGTLHVRVPGATAQFVLREGRLTFARSEAWSEGIVSILQRAHRLTAEQRTHLEQLVAKKGDPQAAGELAIKEGFVTADELVRLVSNQLVHRVLESFRWREGFHRFEAGVTAAGSKTSLDLDAPSLLHWGLRRDVGGDCDVELFLASRRTPLQRHTALDPVLATLPMSRAEKWLLERADGSASFDDLLSEVPASDRQARAALHRAACALAALGAVSAPARAVTAPVEDVLELDIAEVAPPSRAALRSPCAAVLEPWRGKATGTLVVEWADGSARLLFRDGQLVGVRHAADERLDALLVRRGRLRADAASQLALILKGRSVAEVLVEMQAFTAPQLVQFVGAELGNVLRSLTALAEARCEFLPGAVDDADLPRHAWDPSLLLAESVRAQSLGGVRARLPGDAVVVRRVDAWRALSEGLTLQPAESRLLEALAQPSPCARLVGAAGAASEERQRALGVLLSLGLVVPVTAAVTPPVPVARQEDEEDPLAGIDPAIPLVDAHEQASDAAPDEELLLEVSSDPPAPVKAKAPGWGAGTPAAPRSQSSGPVSRAMYEQVLAEKRALEEKLRHLVERQTQLDAVMQENYRLALAEQDELRQKLAQAQEALASARTSSPPPPRAAGELDDGGVISFKRRRSPAAAKG